MTLMEYECCHVNLMFNLTINMFWRTDTIWSVCSENQQVCLRHKSLMSVGLRKIKLRPTPQLSHVGHFHCCIDQMYICICDTDHFDIWLQTPIILDVKLGRQIHQKGSAMQWYAQIDLPIQPNWNTAKLLLHLSVNACYHSVLPLSGHQFTNILAKWGIDFKWKSETDFISANKSLSNTTSEVTPGCL